MVMALAIAVATNFFAYFFSDKVVLAMYGARPVKRSQDPELYETVEELAQVAGIPTPRLYIIADPSPNAFATGRNPDHAALAVTEGILSLLSPRELRGVLGHELAHIKNRDILIGTIAATIAGAMSMLAHMVHWTFMFGGRSHGRDREGMNPISEMITILLAPLAAMLIQVAISRSREYQADLSGAGIHGDPLDLASALRKIAEAGRRVPFRAEPATAHLFIMNPLCGDELANLFSTHPPVRERVKRLEAMARGARRAALLG